MTRRLLLVVGLLIGLGACSSQNIDLPTLVPTLQPRLTAPDPITPTVQLTATDVPTVTSAPTQTAVSTPVLTLPPLLIVRDSNSTTITLSAAQIDDALARRFADNPIPDYAAPPHVTFEAGQLRLDLSITPKSGTPQPLSLTLAITALNTTAGNVLDLRATGVSALNGFSTLQVKKSQAMLKAALEDIAQRAIGSSTIAYSYVTISADALSITVFIP